MNPPANVPKGILNGVRILDFTWKPVGPWAPRLLTLKINPEKIGKLIGPGGKNIKAIQDVSSESRPRRVINHGAPAATTGSSG